MKITDSKLRAKAKRLDIRVVKRGGYMLVDLYTNTFVAGENFNLSLSDAWDWLTEYENATAIAEEKS